MPWGRVTGSPHPEILPPEIERTQNRGRIVAARRTDIVAAGDDDDDGRDLEMAGADGLPGLFQHGQQAAGGLGVLAWRADVGPRRGGRAGPAGAVAGGVVLQAGGQVFVGFGDAPEPVDGPGIGVVAVGVMLAGEFAVGLLDIGQGGV
jgi:hypothetical protein